MPWTRGYYKDNKVWLKVDEDDNLVVDGRRATMKFTEKEDAKQYQPYVQNISLIDPASNAAEAEGTAPARTQTATTPPPEVADELDTLEISRIEVYTDGACSGNPGPAGYGFVVLNDDGYFEEAGFIGEATNNVAELSAIDRALEHLEGRTDRRIVLHTDSRYCVGVLSKGWNAKQNTELIEGIKQRISQFEDLTFEKVKGHSGHTFNERADTLATSIVP